MDVFALKDAVEASIAEALTQSRPNSTDKECDDAKQAAATAWLLVCALGTP